MDIKITMIIMAVLVVAMPPAHSQGPAATKPDGDNILEAYTEVSSRQLIGEDKLAWIEKMRQNLPIAMRKIGPFGMPQNPNEEIAKPKQTKPKEGAFLKAIAAIKVNTVMPSDNKFTIGSREFRKGDVFPIIRDQRQFNIEIVAVRTDNILFKNVDTGEYVKRNLNTLPKGMQKNAPLDTVPGVVPANKKDETPLNLDDEPIPVSND